MYSFNSITFAEVYKDVLKTLLNDPEYTTAPRGQNIKECTNVIIELENPYSNLYENERRGSQVDYINAELEWYFSGSNTIEYIGEKAKMWKTLLNPDGKTVNSAYGHLLFNEPNEYGITEYEWAIESLKRDKDSRQAIMHFNKPKHLFFENKDQVCTLEGTFQIREDKLNFTIVMRSNDAVLGLPTDIAFFTILQQQALLHLKQYYPTLKMGTYTHIVHSLHLYERNFGVVEEMLKHDFIQTGMPELTQSVITEKGERTDAKIF